MHNSKQQQVPAAAGSGNLCRLPQSTQTPKCRVPGI